MDYGFQNKRISSYKPRPQPVILDHAKALNVGSKEKTNEHYWEMFNPKPNQTKVEPMDRNRWYSQSNLLYNHFYDDFQGDLRAINRQAQLNALSNMQIYIQNGQNQRTNRWYPSAKASPMTGSNYSSSFS
jgi:hypothetical protein